MVGREEYIKKTTSFYLTELVNSYKKESVAWKIAKASVSNYPPENGLVPPEYRVTGFLLINDSY